MGGLLAALNSGKTGLFANQKLIEIAGHNISNVNTPGYSRQHAEVVQAPSLNFNGFFIGTGVRIASIEREHDVFLTNQLRQKYMALGEESGKTSPLTELESVFNISEQNLAAEIDNFFDSWQELSANPHGQIERDLVMRRGATLADAFHATAQGLINIQQNINNSLASKFEAVNTKLQEVADLNERINAIEATGQPANAPRDRRDYLVEELSHTLGVYAYEENNKMVTVQLPGGLPLVQGTTALPLNGVTIGQDIQFQVQYGSTALDVSQDNLGGEFKGLVYVRDQLIPAIKGDLDKIAYDLVTTINTQHQAGVGLDGISRDFFTSLTVETDASQKIAVQVQSTDEIAAGASTAPGDNTNAQLIAALRDQKIINGTDTFIEAYGKISATVGLEANQNQLSLQGTEDALVQLQNMRDGLVGVSLEEEMINLIQFQSAFEASAKLLATVDEMMDTLLSFVR